jgi:sugar lactone lactonase YvrE
MSHINYLSFTKQRTALLLALSLLILVVAPLVFSRVVESRSRVVDGNSASEQTDFVREIPLATNDVVYSTSTGKLYASVPSSAGSIGNRIATINPVTGSVDNSVFIGSEPNLLAISDDGNSLYASLEGVFAIRRFDTQTDTPGAQFSTGVASLNRRMLVSDFAVAPGNPNVLAIARQYSGTSPPDAGVAIFDNGVQRPNTAPDHSAGSEYVAFSASASKLYGCGKSSSLKTMAVDASGVTVTATVPFSVSAHIKFNNGLVFSSTGQVVNADTATQLGKFPADSDAFVADSSVGRAFYASGDPSSGSLSIEAFDINTFQWVGSVTVPGAYGDPTALIRWGANGLALRTHDNQLFLIQTSLIPSDTPIPTPTPTPVATPSPSPATFATFVRQISLPTNDLVYDQPTQRLYASVPSSAGSNGNTITPIDPATGLVGSFVFVGSEPTKMAQADDGQTMYVALNGASAVRQFNTATQTAGAQFSLGRNNFDGPYNFADLAVAPGNPQTVAVARQFGNVFPAAAGVVIFDNGVQRPNSSPSSANSSKALAFSSSASTLYGNSYGTSPGLSTMTLDATGITNSTFQTFDPGNSIRFVNGLVYGTLGQVINPTTGELVGTFKGIEPANYATLMAVDAANGRVFFLTGASSNSWLRAYDINTFVPLGSVLIPGASGSSVTSLVRWGTNGIAFRTNNKVFIIQSALVNAADPVPAATPTPSPTPAPTPVAAFVKKIELPANDIVYSQATQQLYASVPSSGGANANSITRITPETAAIAQSVLIGGEPNRLAISADGQTLYTNLNGASAIRRFDVPTQTPGLQFSTNTPYPSDIEIFPGNPDSIVISTGNYNGVVIYDNGVARPKTGTGGYTGVLPLEFGATSSTLYGYDSSTSNFALVKFSVDASGATATNVAESLLTGFNSALKFSNGLLYSGSGRIVDPETMTLIGTFQVGGNAMAVDAANGRAFYIYSTGSSMTLSAFDTTTFRPLGSVVLPGIAGTPGSLVRWGVNGLAFNTISFATPTASRVYLVQTTLVSSAGAFPAGVQLNQATTTASESVGNLLVGVSRAGDVSAALFVDYATSNGTATAGSDYSSTSGTLNFAAGEVTTNITVPIINDTIYEGTNETFTLTLSNPTNGTLLTNSSTVVTITENDPKPSLAIASSLSSNEGDSGTSVFNVNVTLSNPTFQQVTVKYATQDGTAADGSDYVAASGTLTFPPGTTYLPVAVTVNGDTAIEHDETFVINLSNATNVTSVSTSQAVVTIANDDSSIQLSASGYSLVESSNSLVISVTRMGDLSSPAAVSYATTDAAGANGCGAVTGIASSRCDYLSAVGTLNFAAGQSSTTISIPIVDDTYAEGTETFVLDLSNPSVGSLGSTPTATITITDNETVNGINPIDQANFFVRLHYLDFLNREPDASGLAYWSNQITECQEPGASCDAEVRRINVSAAFFLSIEFQETGYLVERIYKSAYGDSDGTSTLGGASHTIKVPIVRFNEFLADTQQIGKSVVVGAGDWQTQLENNKVAFTQNFVARSRFITAYPTTMTPAQFVDALFLKAVVTPTDAERSSIINEFGGAGTSADTAARARALRRVAENALLKQQETSKAFVLMQYFGYLRRDPNGAPDTDHTGYDYWLQKLNDFNGNFVNAEMVKAFISSTEYRQRFGP